MKETLSAENSFLAPSEKVKVATSLSDPNNYISFMFQLLHPLEKIQCYPLKSTVNLYVMI
jgi:hypothetical protein